MFSSARSLARSLLMVMALVLLIATLIQPATFSHAQEDEPPPSPTAGPPQGEQPAAGVALKGEPTPNNTPAVPAGTSREPVQPAAPVSDFAPMAPLSSTTTPAQSKPQATQLPNTFHVNIIASATVVADGLLTYSIYFTNTAPIAYQNVILQNGIGGAQRYTGCDSIVTCPFTYTGTLATSPTLKEMNGNGNSYDSRQIVWNLGNVQPGQKGRISYTVRVWRDLYPQSERPVSVLGNTVALYDGGAINQDRKLNEDQWGVLVVGPVFNFSKTVDKRVALQRERITYTISLGNKTHPNDLARLDARDAHNAQIIDIVPSTLDPNSITIISPGGRKETHGSETWVVWDIPLLAVGSTQTRQFSATIKDTLSECNAVDNDRYYATSDEFPFNEQGFQMSIRGPNAQTFIAPPVALDVQVVTPGPIYVGDAVKYVINAKNNLDTALDGLEILFYLPPDFSYTKSTPNGVYDTNTKIVKWSNVHIDAKVNFDTPGLTQFTVETVAGRKIDSNKAYAEFKTPLPGNHPSGCLRKVERNVDVQPLLYANKSVQTGTSSTWVLSGTDVIYTIELVNISLQPMTNVSLVDYIPSPPGGPFVFKAMVSGPAPSSSTSTQLFWNNLTIPAATSSTAPGRTTLRFTMTVRGRPNECRDNRILPDSLPSQARETSGGLICIAFPWNVDKEVDVHGLSPRSTERRLVFTLTYENLVGTDVNMTPKDEFLARARDFPYIFDRMIQGPDPINKIPDANGRLNWAPIILHGHETVVYKFEVLLPLGNDGLIPTGTYCNRGILWPNGPEYDYYIYTVPDACTTVSSLELHVSKWLDRRDVGLGELVTYGIELTNNSDDPVSQLVVSDTLPVNVLYIQPATGSLPPTVTELPNGRQLLRWENILVPAHNKTIVAFKARAPALIGPYRNVVEVSGGNPAPAFTCDYGFSPTGGCQGVVDLNVTNLVTIDPQPTPASAQPGDIITYNVSLVSNNNIPYVNTIITDTLPLGFTFVEMVTGPVPYRPRPDVLIWNNQTIPPRDGNNAGRLTYVFRAKAPLSYGSFRSRVEASSPTGTIPTVDNAGRVLITPPNPALSLVAPSLVQIGSDVTFRISLVNPLATPLTGVTINHALPASFVYKGVGTGTPAPTVNGQTLTWNSVTIPGIAQDGTPGIVELIVIATAPNAEGTATSTVTASGGSVPIDQTYNKVDMIIAQLRYIFIPFIGSSG
jgi:uncharacterized repeat protein (TIGR01451 family)